MLTRNAAQFANHNLRLTATARDGSNTGKEYVFNSRDSCKMSGNGKSVALKGDTMQPVAIVPGSGDPEWSFKLTVAEEGWDFAQFLTGDGSSGLGASATRFDLVGVWSRTGKGTRTIESKGCLVEKGFGFDTGVDAPPSDEFSGKATDYKIDGVSVFPTPTA